MKLLLYLIFLGVPIVCWFFTARKKENFFTWIGLKKITPKASLYILIVFNIIINYIFPKYITPLFMPPGLTAQSQYAGMGLSAFPSILYFGLLQTGLTEEIFFRGFLLKRFQNKLGFFKGNTIQSLIFAIPHSLPLLLISTDLWFPALMGFLLSGFTGWMYGYISEKSSGGSIVVVILLHGVGNVAVSLLQAFGLL